MEEVQSEKARSTSTDERDLDNLKAAQTQASAAKMQAEAVWPTLGVNLLSIFGVIGALVLSARANKTATNSLALARKTTDHQLRAYIGIAKTEARLTGDGAIVARLIVKNFGSTPAHGVTSKSKGWVGEFPTHIAPESHPIADDLTHVGTVHPGAEFEIYAVGTVSDIEAIANGDQGFYVYGSIEYMDFNSVKRSTEFCWRGTENTLLSKGELRPSFHGNDAT